MPTSSLSSVQIDRHRFGPFAWWFRSVVVLVDAERGSRSTETLLDRLIPWIESHDRWYKVECGILEGGNLHMMYNREVLLAGTDLLSYAESLQTVGAACSSCGYTLSLATNVEDAQSNKRALHTLTRSRHIGNLVLRIEEGSAIRPRSLRRIIVDVLHSGVPLGLVAQVPHLSDLGLLDLLSLEAATTNIFPTTFASNGFASCFPGNIDGCVKDFRLHITADGEIFPCLGLAGIATQSLGNVGEDIGCSALVNPAVRSQLDMFALRGPALPGGLATEELQYLSDTCNMHRALLMLGQPSSNLDNGSQIRGVREE